VAKLEAALDLESSALGLGGSTPPAPTKDVHVRQIRLAAAVRKTATPWVLEVQILSHAPELLRSFFYLSD
jgi:hypothetical protein